jgi:hypothetical protein
LPRSITQKYVSNELTHFVGQGLSYEEQFQKLSTILSSGELKSRIRQQNVPPHASVPPYAIFNPFAKFSENEMYFLDMVCFCDIPYEDLGIHINKYSSFGLSFSKDFIVSKGGVPVLYFPKKAILSNQTKCISQYFDTFIPHYFKLFHLLYISRKHPSSTRNEL